MQSLKILLYGRVHGVGLRYFAAQLALKYFMCGYVKNNSDNSVEILLQGSEDNIRRFRNELFHGNGIIRIEDIKEERVEEESLNDFTIRY